MSYNHTNISIWRRIITLDIYALFRLQLYVSFDYNVLRFIFHSIFLIKTHKNRFETTKFSVLLLKEKTNEHE